LLGTPNKLGMPNKTSQIGAKPLLGTAGLQNGRYNLAICLAL
jgi:hypothetical protein